MKNLLKGEKKFSKKKRDTEVPESKKLCLEAGDIKKEVCRHYEIREAALSKSRRGVENEARDLAIYLLRYVRGERLEKIGEEFNLGDYSSVNNAISRVKRRLHNHKFKKTLRENIRLTVQERSIKDLTPPYWLHPVSVTGAWLRNFSRGILMIWRYIICERFKCKDIKGVPVPVPTGGC